MANCNTYSFYDRWLNIVKHNIFDPLKREIEAWKRTYSLENWILCFRDELERNPEKLISQFDVYAILVQNCAVKTL